MTDAITDPQTQSSYTQADSNVNAVPDTPVGGQDDNQRVLGRQIPSGNIRGDQTITGSLIINNPTTNTTTMKLSGSDGSFVFTNPKTGINQILIGFTSAGQPLILVSNPGIDVLTLL